MCTKRWRRRRRGLRGRQADHAVIAEDVEVLQFGGEGCSRKLSVWKDNELIPQAGDLVGRCHDYFPKVDVFLAEAAVRVATTIEMDRPSEFAEVRAWLAGGTKPDAEVCWPTGCTLALQRPGPDGRSSTPAEDWAHGGGESLRDGVDLFLGILWTVAPDPAPR